MRFAPIIFPVIYISGFMVTLLFFFMLQHWKVADGDKVAPPWVGPWFFVIAVFWPLGILAFFLLWFTVWIVEFIWPDLRRKKR